MFNAYVILAALLSAVLVFSAFGKLTRQKQLVDQMVFLRVPDQLLPYLGTAQIAGALGLITGIWSGPLGTAAAVGVLVYFIGAVAAHVRANDYQGTVPAAALAIIAGILIAVRAATL